jgi:hypothetical protein
MINTPIDFLGYSLIALYFLIYGINLFFTTEEIKKKRISILENCAKFNPFFRWSYKYLPTPYLNLGGVSSMLLGSFFMILMLAGKCNLEIEPYILIVYASANLLIISFLLYIINLGIKAFKKNKIKIKFAYNFVSIHLNAIPQISLILLFIIYFIFHGLFLYKCLKT